MFEGFDGWLRVDDEPYSVSEFLERTNFTLERELSEITLEGEVGSFKINQGKWVFFDLKDDSSSVSCFFAPTPVGGKVKRWHENRSARSTQGDALGEVFSDDSTDYSAR